MLEGTPEIEINVGHMNKEFVISGIYYMAQLVRDEKENSDWFPVWFEV